MFNTVQLAFFLAGITLMYANDISPSNPPNEIIAKCKKENDFNGTLVELKFDEKTPKNAKCFLACLLLDQNVMNKDGKINAEEGKVVLKKMFDRTPVLEKVLAAFDKCKEAKAQEDNCDIAFEYFKCIFGLLKQEGKN